MRCHIYVGCSSSKSDTHRVWASKAFCTFSRLHKTHIFPGQEKKKSELRCQGSSAWKSATKFHAKVARVYLISLFCVTWWVLIVYFDRFSVREGP